MAVPQSLHAAPQAFSAESHLVHGHQRRTELTTSLLRLVAMPPIKRLQQSQLVLFQLITAPVRQHLQQQVASPT